MQLNIVAFHRSDDARSDAIMFFHRFLFAEDSDIISRKNPEVNHE